MAFAKSPPFAVLAFLSAVSVLPVNMFVPALPAITADLQASLALANLAVAGFAVVAAATHLVAGALSDRFGRRPVALVALAGFTIASVGCCLATSIAAFLLCRLLQGVVSAGYAVSLAAIRDTSDERAAASRIGYLSSVWAVAPMIGPAVGGALDAIFGWRSVFLAFALLGAAGFCLAAAALKETNLRPTASAILQARGCGDLGRSGTFWAYVLCMAFGLGTLYAFLAGAPWVSAQLGVASSLALGLYMGLVPAGFILGSYLVGHSGARYTSPRLILAGRLLTSAGLLVGLVLYLAGVTHPMTFFGPCICVGVGNGLTMPAANARVLSIRPDLAGTASGLATALTVTGAAGVAYLSGLVVDAANAHPAVLGVMFASSLLSLGAIAAVFSLEQPRRIDPAAGDAGMR